jgi:hypothetical protein
VCPGSWMILLKAGYQYHPVLHKVNQSQFFHQIS